MMPLVYSHVRNTPGSCRFHVRPCSTRKTRGGRSLSVSAIDDLSTAASEGDHVSTYSMPVSSRNTCSQSYQDLKHPKQLISKLLTALRVPDSVSSSSSSEDTATSVESLEEPLRVYWYRWYILAIFSLCSMLNVFAWNTFGPVTPTLRVLFNWSDYHIGILTYWDPLCFLVAAIPVCWAMERKGLRPVALVSMACMLIGVGVRCIPMPNSKVIIGMATGQLLNGIAGPLGQIGPAVLSSHWFPANERTTATAISAIFAYLGYSLSFIVGPLFVPEPHQSHVSIYQTSAWRSYWAGEPAFMQLFDLEWTSMAKEQGLQYLNNLTEEVLLTRGQPTMKGGFTFIAQASTILAKPEAVVLQPSDKQGCGISVHYGAEGRTLEVVVRSSSLRWSASVLTDGLETVAWSWSNNTGLQLLASSGLLPVSSVESVEACPPSVSHTGAQDYVLLLQPSVLPADMLASIVSSDSLHAIMNLTKANTTVDDLKEELALSRKKLYTLLNAECVIAGVLFLLNLAFFPNKPPSPPSTSAASDRFHFSKAMKKLLRMKNFWILVIISGSILGIHAGWLTVLSVNLSNSIVITQLDLGWLGFYSTVAGTAAGLAIARFIDMFGGCMKAALLFLFAGATGGFLWIAFICIHVAPSTIASLYASNILANVCVYCMVPLFYELAVEATYPVGEALSTGLLNWFINAFMFVFLFLMAVPSLGTRWMNWMLAGSCLLTIPALLFFEERYRRSEVDVEDSGVSEEEEGGSTEIDKLEVVDLALHEKRQPVPALSTTTV